MSGSTQFTGKFLLPIVAATAMTVVALVGFLAWSAARVDADALARDRLLLERALEDLQAQLFVAQEELATWDEAVTAYEQGDRSWLADNLGAAAFDTFGHSRTLILDRDSSVVLAMREGGQLRSKAIGNDAISDLAPFIAAMNTPETEARISAYNAGVSEDPPQAMDFASFEGRPALIGLMPILSYSGENTPEIGTEGLYASILLLDGRLASELSNKYRIEQPQFVDDPPPADFAAALPVDNAAGAPVAWLTWEADRPGTRLLQSAMPGLVAAIFAGLLIVGLLLRSLHRALRALQSEREEASHRALHDPLTGLGNRSLFRMRLSDGFRAMPAGEPRLAVLALDLDRFKQVNDTLGHQAGDELLTVVASRLKELMRPQDTLIRFGGDEFAIIQPGIVSHDEPQALAQSIIDALCRPVALAAGLANIGVSIGIATAPDLARGETELLRFADDALYRAKNGGRNRYCLYTSGTPQEPARRQAQVSNAFGGNRAAG